MEDQKKKPALSSTADIQLLIYTGSGWRKVQLPLQCDNFGGIGKIRLEDNLRRVGAGDPRLRLPGLEADAAAGTLSLLLDEGLVRLNLQPGDCVIALPIGKRLELWTTGQLPKTK